MSRRGHEVHAEALAVVHGARESSDLELAAIAGPGVDLPDRERTAKEASGSVIDLVEQADDVVAGRREGLGRETDLKDLGEEAHATGVETRGAAPEAWSACR